MMHVVDMYPTLVGLAGGTLDKSKPLDGLDVWATISEGKVLAANRGRLQRAAVGQLAMRARRLEAGMAGAHPLQHGGACPIWRPTLSRGHEPRPDANPAEK